MAAQNWHDSDSIPIKSPGHTWNVFSVSSFRRVVEVFEKKLVELDTKDKFYAIAGCGNSGVPLAATLSHSLGIPMITVRKPGEQTVAYSEKVTGAVEAGKYLLIDDQIGSGGTVNRVMDAILEASGGRTKPTAILLYNQRDESDHPDWGYTRWKSCGARVPLYGMTEDEQRYINNGTRSPTKASTAQLSLLDWADMKKVRESGEKLAESVRRYQDRLANKAADQARMWFYMPTRNVAFVDIGKLCLPDIDLVPCPMELNLSTPKSRKPPKYQPPSWIVGKQYDRPKNIKPPGGAR